MVSDFEKNLEKYAEVIVKVGLNIQPGQRLLIGPPWWGTFGTELEFAPLVRLIATKAYQTGARLVDVLWRDAQLQLIRLQNAPLDSFEEFPTWRSDGAIEAAQAGDAILLIFAPNHFLFTDQDPVLLSKVQSTGNKQMKPFLDLRGKLKMNFAIVAAVSQGWANLIFPDLRPEEQLTRLWEMVFKLCRVDQPDPVSAWRDHSAKLRARCEYLNKKQYTQLHMTAPGTDLKIGLPDGHIWKGGGSTTQNGIAFIANIPTEEVFTLPHKDKTEGHVISTRPMGLIEDLSLTFSEGKVVKANARKNEGLLQKLLETDAGAKRLGEVALVAQSTPIAQTGMVFNNLLIDENASSHLALGNGYKFCIDDGEQMSDDQFMYAGGNKSQNHVDFMIGSEEFDVDGIKQDDSTEPVMRGGEWVFDV